MSTRTILKKVLLAASLCSIFAAPSFANHHMKGHQKGEWSFDRDTVHFQSDSVCKGSHMNTYFSVFLHDTDRANLDPIEQDAIARAVAKAKRTQGQDVVFWVAVDSYADSRGSDEHNYKLTDKRARAVIKALVDSGAPKNRIHVVSHGEKHALYSNATIKGMQMNRASHIKIHTMTSEQTRFCYTNYPDAIMSIH